MSHKECQMQITDLIAEAVSNAKIRRNQVTNSEICLSPLSYEEMESIAGGGKPPRKSTLGVRTEQTSSVSTALLCISL